MSQNIDIMSQVVYSKIEVKHEEKNVINLIRYHAEENEAAFREEVYEIAKYFDSIKDYELSEYAQI